MSAWLLLKQTLKVCLQLNRLLRLGKIQVTEITSAKNNGMHCPQIQLVKFVVANLKATYKWLLAIVVQEIVALETVALAIVVLAIAVLETVAPETVAQEIVVQATAVREIVALEIVVLETDAQVKS